MSDFSKSPLELLASNLEKGYVGIHIEQGVPLLDRDLNLLHDLVAATVRSVITRYLGNGLAADADGFIIQPSKPNPLPDDFRISKGAGALGACLVGGLEVIIDADVPYSAQPSDNIKQAIRDGQKKPADLTIPPAARIDIVYLDVWLSEIDAAGDSDLGNSTDVGMETSVRIKPFWLVRVAEGGPLPAAPAGHTFFPLAQLNRTAPTAAQPKPPLDATVIRDQRQTQLTMSTIENRLRKVEQMVLLPAFATVGPQFEPNLVIANQTVNIHGSNFAIGTPRVTFSSDAASIDGPVDSFTPTLIVVRVPPGLTGTSHAFVRLTVQTDGGSVTSDPGPQERLLEVLPDPVFDPGKPFEPAQAKTGDSITLRGFNFNVTSPTVPAVQVRFNNVLATTFVGAPTLTKIVVKVPPGLPVGSPITIAVTTGAGSVTASNFKVTA